MHIRQPVNIGLVDEHGIGVWDIKAAFNDRCGQQNVGFAGDKFHHRLFKLVFVHLAMSDCEAGFGDDSFQAVSNLLNIVYPIVDKVDLSAAI